MKLLCVNVLDTPNLGDLAASPRLYVPWLADAEAVNLRSVTADRLRGAFVVLGGGGLFQGAFPDQVALVARLAQRRQCTAVVWGAGVNREGARAIEQDRLQRELAGFSAVGLRDHGTPWRWCPGVSCLHPAFDNPPAPTHDIIAYEHHDHPLGLPLPTATNATFGSVAEAAAFIASGRTVVTNTYHGAYWATLLGRPVAVCEPFSSRFHHLKHKPTFTPRHPLRTGTRSYLFVLAECREANRRFAAVVRQRLEATR